VICNLPEEYLKENPELQAELAALRLWQEDRIVFRRVFLGPRGTPAFRIPVNQYGCSIPENTCAAMQQGACRYVGWDVRFRGCLEQGPTPLEAVKQGLFEFYLNRALSS